MNKTGLDQRYRELCERETPFWRWTMPFVMSAIVDILGVAVILAQLRYSTVLRFSLYLVRTLGK